MIRFSLFGPLLAGFVFIAVTNAPAHQGIPVDPSITEESPREYSALYLERKDLPWTKIEDGIEYQVVRKGDGAKPYEHAMVYVMWRMFDLETGEEIYYRTKHRTDKFFYSGNDPVALGGGGTLRAVELALADMREGGKRLLKISSEKAFGKEGWSDSHFVVPPDMNAVIELSLLWVSDPNPKRFTTGEPYPRPHIGLPEGEAAPVKEKAEAEEAAAKTKEEKDSKPTPKVPASEGAKEENAT